MINLAFRVAEGFSGLEGVAERSNEVAGASAAGKVTRATRDGDGPFGLTFYPKERIFRVICLPKKTRNAWNLQGALDLLIVRTLIFGPEHGQRIAQAIQHTSEHELLVEHGALYPALQPLQERGSISAKWGTSANNRKARFYPLRRRGQQLVKATTKWKRLAATSARVLGAEAEEG